MEFVDRKLELAALERLYRLPSFQFVPIFGRRRIGKTRLVREFLRDKVGIYHLAETVSEGEQLRALGRTVGEHLGDSILAEAGFRDWHQCFAYLASRDVGRLVLVIDEFPYLVSSNAGIGSIFQKGIDEHLHDTKLFLILMGSSIGMMEKEMLFYKAPLYGRRTGALEVGEIAFPDAAGFLPGMDFNERVRCHAVFGSTPAYLERLDPSRGALDNARDLILQPGSMLFQEVEFLLREELREPRNYFAILRALALGKRRVSEIVNETGFEKTLVARYLDILRDLRLVRREVPITERQPEKSKLGLYGLCDPFVAFWFRYVLPHRSRIEMGEVDRVVERIRGDFEAYVSGTFEVVCRDLVRVAMQQGRIGSGRVGRWWSRLAEIDVLALDDEARVAWFGECKWSERPVGEDVYRQLVGAAAQAGDAALPGWERRFVLFSKSGFTAGMKALARKDRVCLIDQGEGWLTA